MLQQCKIDFQTCHWDWHRKFLGSLKTVLEKYDSPQCYCFYLNV